MRLVSELRERILALMFRGREDRELEEELAFHLESATEENMRQGMSLPEAKRHAAIALGGVERTKDEVRDARGTSIFEHLGRDVRIAIRRLTRERSFSLPAVANIALGIGVAVAVFSMVNAVLIRPLPFPQSDRLVHLGHIATRSGLAVSGQSPGTFRHYRESNVSLDGMAAYMEYGSTVTDDADAPEQIRVASVSRDLFTVLHVVPLLGGLPNADNDRTSVLLSHDFWVRRYGADSSLVGRTIEIAREAVVVVGIAQPGFHFPTSEIQLWMTGQIDELIDRFGAHASIEGLFLNSVGRLADDASVNAAQRDLDRLMRSLPAAFTDVSIEDIEAKGLRVVVNPLKSQIVGDARTALLMLLATGAFLLFITWANATNLCVLRAERLRSQIAVERALGATKGRLFQRFISESGVLAATGGILGFLLARFAIAVRFGFDPTQIPRLAEIDIGVASVILTASLTVVTAALLTAGSLVSARRASVSSQPVGSLNAVNWSPKNQLGRQLLVAGQIALTLVLLVGSSLMLRSYQKLASTDLGFRSTEAITFALPLPASPYTDRTMSTRVHNDVRQRLLALPGIDAVESATTAAFPLTPVPDHYNDRVMIAGMANDTAATRRALFSFATPGYFRTMGIPIIQGRSFEHVTSSESPEVVLSASLAQQLFGNGPAVGRRVRSLSTGESHHLVVGVVGNTPGRSVRDGPSHIVYFANLHPEPAYTDDGTVQSIVLRDEQYVVRSSLPPTALFPTIRQVLDEVDPKLVMSGMSSMDALITDSLVRPRMTMLLLVAAASAALVVGLTGIYGVLSYAVGQRTKELGIRVALGATPRRVARLVVGQGAVLALVGIVVGILGALYLAKYLESLLYGVAPNDPATFVGAAALLLGVSLGASYIPARRASQVDPVRALKT